MQWSDFDDDARAVLEILHQDSTLEPAEIAEQTGLKSDEVEELIEKFEDSGAIRGFHTVLDPRGLGYHVMAYLFVECRENYDAALRETVKNIQTWDGTQGAQVVLGSFDIMIRRIDPTPSDLDLFATNALNHPQDFYRPETYSLTQIIRLNGQDLPEKSRRRFSAEPLADRHKAVLRALQEDARRRNDVESVAKAADIDPSDAIRSIDFLESQGYIRGYSVNFDPGALNWMRAFVGISTYGGKYDDVVDALLAIEPKQKVGPAYIPYVFSGLGQNWADIAVEIAVDSVKHLDELTDYIRSISGIETTRTHLATKTLYSNGHVPLG